MFTDDDDNVNKDDDDDNVNNDDDGDNDGGDDGDNDSVNDDDEAADDSFQKVRLNSGFCSQMVSKPISFNFFPFRLRLRRTLGPIL